MTDDQDRCEWVNVSFDTGSPGCTRQSPGIRKTVVCSVHVCACVHMCTCVCVSPGFDYVFSQYLSRDLGLE